MISKDSTGLGLSAFQAHIILLFQFQFCALHFPTQLSPYNVMSLQKESLHLPQFELLWAVTEEGWHMHV